MTRFNKGDLLYIIEKTRSPAFTGNPQADIIFAKATLMLQEGNYEGYKVRRRKVRVQSNPRQVTGRDTESAPVREEQVSGEQLEEGTSQETLPERGL